MKPVIINPKDEKEDIFATALFAFILGLMFYAAAWALGVEGL